MILIKRRMKGEIYAKDPRMVLISSAVCFYLRTCEETATGHKNTFDDVQFLARVGLVELRKTKAARERTTPEVNYDRILLEIQV